MSNSNFNILIFILILSLSISHLAFGQDPKLGKRLVEEVNPILKKLYPKSAVRIVTDINTDECEMAGSQQGVLKADLNGDGKEDYAVLAQIKLNHSENITDNPEDFKGVDLTLLALVKSSNDKYDKFILRKIEGFWVGTVLIDAEKPRTIHETETNATLHLNTTGVALIYCGKSQVDYYWNGNEFKQIWVAD